MPERRDGSSKMFFAVVIVGASLTGGCASHVTRDGGGLVDASVRDAGRRDAGRRDAGPSVLDAAPADAGSDGMVLIF